MSESTIDVGIDVGKARLAYAWPYWEMAGSIDLAREKLPRHIELLRLREWLQTKVPETIQLWIDRPLFAGTGTESGARLTETVSTILTAQQWVRAPQIVFGQSWKSQTVGYPATKDEIRSWLNQHHPRLARRCTTEDECDAMVIGLYGRGRSEGVILPPGGSHGRRRRTAAG